MSRTLWPAIVAAAIAAPLLADSALFAQPPADTPRVARLVRDLGADSFAVRTQASEELAKLGATARREIELAIRSDDPEVRLRAKDLLRAIKVHELWGAGRFTCPNKPTPAAQLLRSLAEQTGNHVLVGDQFGTFQDSPVQFEFCRSRLLADDRRALSPNGQPLPPALLTVACPAWWWWQAHGPAAPGVHRSGARAHHERPAAPFNEELSYEDARSEKTHTFQLNLEMTWEDRFKLVAYRSQLEVVEAHADAGPGAGGGLRLPAAAGTWPAAARGN